MKKPITTFCIFLIGVTIIAQTPQAFKYQAVIRNSSGDIIADQAVSIRLTILEGYPGGTSVYSEIQQPVTNQFGMVSLELGLGILVSGNFEFISWRHGNHFLQIELDETGSSNYQLMGVSPFLSVPYTMWADSAGNVVYSDTSAINEIQHLSIIDHELSIDNGNTVMLPDEVEDADPDPTNEFQILEINVDTLFISNGNYVVLPPGESLWLENGSNIYYNTGNVGIGTTDPEFKLSLNDDGGILAKGEIQLGSTLITTGEGTRLIWYPRKAAFRAGVVSDTAWNDENIGFCSNATGFNTIANGGSSTAMGSGTVASGDGSTALGLGSIASGYSSTAIGSYALANGNTSFAMGNSTTASGFLSIAAGQSSVASGNYSNAFGMWALAEALLSTAIGVGNIGGGSPNDWILTDPLFEIGNGFPGTTRANAMTVLKNGNTGIGIHNPQRPLHINQKSVSQGIRLEYSGTSYWDTYVDVLQDYNFAYNGLLKSYILDTDGSYVAVSDRNLKTDIQPLPQVLMKVNQLNPCYYRFKDSDPDGKKSVGMIAQEVEPLFPQTVHEKGGIKAINYDAFAVIAIQAIKEQQEIIDKLDSRVRELEVLILKK